MHFYVKYLITLGRDIVSFRIQYHLLAQDSVLYLGFTYVIQVTGGNRSGLLRQ